jgi:hypothetical protein
MLGCSTTTRGGVAFVVVRAQSQAAVSGRRFLD